MGPPSRWRRPDPQPQLRALLGPTRLLPGGPSPLPLPLARTPPPSRRPQCSGRPLPGWSHSPGTRCQRAWSSGWGGRTSSSNSSSNSRMRHPRRRRPLSLRLCLLRSSAGRWRRWRHLRFEGCRTPEPSSTRPLLPSSQQRGWMGLPLRLRTARHPPPPPPPPPRPHYPPLCQPRTEWRQRKQQRYQWRLQWWSRQGSLPLPASHPL